MPSYIACLPHRKNGLINYAERISVCTLILLTIILPTGSVGPVNVKLTALGLAFSFVLLTKKPDLKFLIFSGLLAILLTAWSIVAQGYGVPIGSTASAANALLSAFAPLLVLHLSTRKDKELASLCIKAALAGCAIYSTFKIILFVAALLGFNITALFELMYLKFGYSPITYNYGWFFRINTPVDFVLVPAILSIIYVCPEMSRASKIALTAIFLTAITIALSRYLYVYAAFSLASILLGGKRKISTTRTILFILIFLIATTLALIFSDRIFQFLSERYFGEYAEKSDSVRYLIFPPMMEQFHSRPLIGSGLGFYIDSTVFFPNAPWNSVLLWLSLLNQFGILGIIILLALFAFPLIVKPKSITSGYLFAIFSYGIFISSGFFNTFLLTSSASILYFIYSNLFSHFRAPAIKIQNQLHSARYGADGLAMKS